MAAAMATVRTQNSAKMLSQQQPQEDQSVPSVVFEDDERTGGVELPYQSNDDIKEMSMTGDAGDVRAEKLQPKLRRHEVQPKQQQQRGYGGAVTAAGGDGGIA